MRAERRRAVGLLADPLPPRRRPRQRSCGSLGHQRLLRGEMRVEPAVRQAGMVHDRVHADRIDPV